MTDQDIFKAIAKVVKVKADNCRDCKGSGKVSHEVKLDNPQSIQMDDIVVDCGTRYDIIPCPTCAPLRELEKELCWHEPCEAEHRKLCDECRLWWITQDDGPSPAVNQDFTTAMSGSRLLIVHYLREARMWDEFVEWLNENIELVCYANPEDDCDCYKKVAGILSDGEKLVPAIGSFLKRDML